MIIIDGKKIAASILKAVAKKAVLLKNHGVQPGLGILMIGEESASLSYVSMKLKAAAQCGFFVKKINLPSSARQCDAEQALQKLQRDRRVHGVIIQIPLPNHLSIEKLSILLKKEKDIDCFNSQNLTGLFLGKNFLFPPPTAEAALRCIASLNITCHQKRIVVLGRGFFGRQIAAHCINHGGIVTLASSRVENIISTTKQADILISAAGRPRFINHAFIKKDCIVIDVGVSRDQNGKLVGDIDMASISRMAQAVTPVPGGVGPITVALLVKNVLAAAMLTLKKK